jgi:trehalose utilization protein
MAPHPDLSGLRRSTRLLAAACLVALAACSTDLVHDDPAVTPDGASVDGAPSSDGAAPPPDSAPPDAGVRPFDVIAFYNGTYDPAHIAFVHEANPWFEARAAEYDFTYTATTDWGRLNADDLAEYEVVMFLDDQPPEDRREAFEAYMRGGGAWFGFHVCAFNTDPSSWDWYHNQLLGTGAFFNNTWGPTTAVLRVEDSTHASMAHLPESFESAVSEWYSWERDLRTNPEIDILASIDPVSFPLGTDPNQSWYDGYYPILWTNRSYRMLYANFGHNGMNYQTNTPTSSTFDSEMQNRFIIDGLLWLGGSSDPSL